MAHYDVFAFSTAVTGIDMSTHQYTSWTGTMATNWVALSDETYFSDYFQQALFQGMSFRLKTGVRWAVNSGYANAIGFSADTSNAYAGSKLDIGKAIQSYLNNLTGSSKAVIHNYQVTTNSLQVALDGYLFGAYHELYSSNTYTQHFDEDTGVITVTFSNKEKLTLKTTKQVISQGKFAYLLDNPKYKYNEKTGESNGEDKYKLEYYVYDKIALYTLTTYPTKENEDGEQVPDTDAEPLGVFNYAYNLGAGVKTPDGYKQIQANSPASITVLNINYSVADDEDNITYRNISYPLNGSNKDLDTIVAVWAKSQLTFNMIPVPWVPFKQGLYYIDKNSTTYTKCCQYVKRLFGKPLYPELYKNISDTPNQIEMANAYLMFGVNLNTKTQAGKKYLYILFKNIYQHFLTARGLTSEDIVNQWYTAKGQSTWYAPFGSTFKSNKLFQLNGYISWYTNNGTTARGIVWVGMVSLSKKGVAQSGAKKGQYFVVPSGIEDAPTILEDEAIPDEEDTIPHKYSATCPGVAFRYQDTNETYQEILVLGLALYNPVGHYGMGNMWSTIEATLANTADSFNYAMQHPKVIKEADTQYGAGEIIEYQHYYDPMVIQTMAAGGYIYDNAGSVYYGHQNVYQGVVLNFQTVNNVSIEYKAEIADDDSGFIIPFDLTMMQNFPMSDLNDLITRGTFLISESYHFEQPHYKGWKKWLAIVVWIVVIIIFIVVTICTVGTGSGPYTGSVFPAVAAFVGGGVVGMVVTAICKIVVAAVIAMLVKVIAKAVFGNTFIGQVFQIVLTVVVCYYTGMFNGMEAWQAGAEIAASAMGQIANYFNEQTKALTAETNAFNSMAETNHDYYNKKMKDLSSMYQDLYGQTSNIDIKNLVQTITSRQTNPIYDGIVNGSKWNNTLLSYTDDSTEILTSELINLDKYIDTDLLVDLTTTNS